MGAKAQALIEKAVKYYPLQDDYSKALLGNIFGLSTFKDAIPIMERLTSWEAACEITGDDPVESLPYPNLVTKLQDAVNGFHQMCIIIDLLREDWEPDYNDSNQYKYEPVFIAGPSGVGLVFFSTSRWLTGASVGARLVFPTREKAEFAGKTFIAIYNKFLTKSK
jgi:hypothetical protein